MTGRIVVLGNSHTHALKMALEDQGMNGDFAIHWVRFEKGASAIHGDISPEDATALVSTLNENDLLAIHLLGTHHIPIGLFEHEVPFDVADESGGTAHIAGDIAMVPRRVLRDEIISRMERTSSRFKTLIKPARCRVVFLMAPPPKNDDAGIAEHLKRKHASFKVNAAPRRLRVWQLERATVSEYASSLGSEAVAIPSETIDEDGFLLPQFSAHDSGHANRQYGGVVLRQLSGLLSERQRHDLNVVA